MFDSNPSGKLATTFANHIERLEQPPHGNLDQTEPNIRRTLGAPLHLCDGGT